MKHFSLLWTNPPDGRRTKQERMGLLSLLLVRELSYYTVSQHTCLLISFIITDWPHSVGGFVNLIFFRYAMAEWFLFATIAALFVTLWFVNRARSEFTSTRSMMVGTHDISVSGRRLLTRSMKRHFPSFSYLILY